MERQELLDAFAALSPGDRTAVRAELIRAEGFGDAPGAGSAMAACIEILDQVKSGADPVKVCRAMLEEMAGFCPQ